VHFLGHDETFPTPTLDQAYRDLIAKHNVKRTYQPHSGAFHLEDRFKTGGTRTGSLQVWTYATPSHYYTSKGTGAWGFAQSGGIGGVVASLESMRRMMPEQALWPPWTDVWSLHTVAQGGNYYNPMLKAVYDRYGTATGIEDFSKKALALNYESARGMFEAYGRNKYDATGITTWKYDAAWPASPTWQYVDWYLIATGAYYGAKKACEPLHVQYAYDDQSVYIINAYSHEFAGLTAEAKLYNLDMTQKGSQTATVNVAADGKAKALTIKWPPGLTTCYFLRLLLAGEGGNRLSDNFYWLSTAPDKPSSFEADFANPLSTADYKELNTLPAVPLKVASRIEEQGAERLARVAVENPSKHLAFSVHLAVKKGENGAEVAPTFWDDNYFSVFPGEKKEVSGRFAAADLEGAAPAITLDGWNVAH
jgi:exo-1,4-beta-D-glucosaminidase